MPRIRTLSDRDLTLSFLARQLLLVRRRMPAHVAVRRLGALQAQYSPSPYVALHSRLEGFRTTGLEAAITRGSVIKATLMRGTLHLVHRRDYPAYAAAWPAGMGAAIRRTTGTAGARTRRGSRRVQCQAAQHR